MTITCLDAGDRVQPSDAACQTQLTLASRRDGYSYCRQVDVLWQAGEVLEALIQRRRNKAAARKLIHKLLRKHGFAPTWVTTDKLRSYGAAFKEAAFSDIACEQNFRYSYLREKTVWATRRPVG
jgi:transposase-like protein